MRILNGFVYELGSIVLLEKLLTYTLVIYKVNTLSLLEQLYESIDPAPSSFLKI